MIESTTEICQNCKWWSMAMAGKFGFHECQNPKVNGSTKSWTDGVATNDDYPLATGPFFGCVHYEK